MNEQDLVVAARDLVRLLDVNRTVGMMTPEERDALDRVREALRRLS